MSFNVLPKTGIEASKSSTLDQTLNYFNCFGILKNAFSAININIVEFYKRNGSQVECTLTVTKHGQTWILAKGELDNKEEAKCNAAKLALIVFLANNRPVRKRKEGNYSSGGKHREKICINTSLPEFMCEVRSNIRTVVNGIIDSGKLIKDLSSSAEEEKKVGSKGPDLRAGNEGNLPSMTVGHKDSISSSSDQIEAKSLCSGDKILDTSNIIADVKKALTPQIIQEILKRWYCFIPLRNAFKSLNINVIEFYIRKGEHVECTLTVTKDGQTWILGKGEGGGKKKARNCAASAAVKTFLEKKFPLRKRKIVSHSNSNSSNGRKRSYDKNPVPIFLYEVRHNLFLLANNAFNDVIFPKSSANETSTSENLTSPKLQDNLVSSTCTENGNGNSISTSGVSQDAVYSPSPPAREINSPSPDNQGDTDNSERGENSLSSEEIMKDLTPSLIEKVLEKWNFLSFMHLRNAFKKHSIFVVEFYMRNKQYIECTLTVTKEGETWTLGKGEGETKEKSRCNAAKCAIKMFLENKSPLANSDKHKKKSKRSRSLPDYMNKVRFEILALANPVVQKEIQRNNSASPDSMKGSQDSKRGSQDSKRGSQDSKRGSQDSKRGSQDSKRGSQDSKRGSQDSKRGSQDSTETSHDSTEKEVGRVITEDPSSLIDNTEKKSSDCDEVFKGLSDDEGEGLVMSVVSALVSSFERYEKLDGNDFNLIGALQLQTDHEQSSNLEEAFFDVQSDFKNVSQSPSDHQDLSQSEASLKDMSSLQMVFEDMGLSQLYLKDEIHLQMASAKSGEHQDTYGDTSLSQNESVKTRKPETVLKGTIQRPAELGEMPHQLNDDLVEICQSVTDLKKDSSHLHISPKETDKAMNVQSQIDSENILLLQTIPPKSISYVYTDPKDLINVHQALKDFKSDSLIADKSTQLETESVANHSQANSLESCHSQTDSDESTSKENGEEISQENQSRIKRLADFSELQKNVFLFQKGYHKFSSPYNFLVESFRVSNIKYEFKGEKPPGSKSNGRAAKGPQPPRGGPKIQRALPSVPECECTLIIRLKEDEEEIIVATEKGPTVNKALKNLANKVLENLLKHSYTIVVKKEVVSEGVISLRSLKSSPNELKIESSDDSKIGILGDDSSSQKFPETKEEDKKKFIDESCLNGVTGTKADDEDDSQLEFKKNVKKLLNDVVRKIHEGELVPDLVFSSKLSDQQMEIIELTIKENKGFHQLQSQIFASKAGRYIVVTEVLNPQKIVDKSLLGMKMKKFFVFYPNSLTVEYLWRKKLLP